MAHKPSCNPLGIVLGAFALILLAACKPAPVHACNPVHFDGAPFTVCSFDVDRADIRLFLTHPDGAPYAQFDRLAAQMEADGTPLLFAMNGGMYHDDRRAVGLYVEDGEQAAPLVTSAGPGNFGMLPNGVFWRDGRDAGITESRAYEALFPAGPPRFATQSGPMLVLDGALHPDFNADGPSRKRRNGVGLSADGRTVHFAISDAPVNFHTFARLFRDRLGTPNALYLDGVVSRLYAPGIQRDEPGPDLGPIVAVVSAQAATP
ncbi:phosphodiester glycosidase family protein [Hyphomonas sp.]|uniref:phosphodiester glycosidase family protein n=1 Tax=Hyphomonas sp. TaxID=87 RepID=UPI003D2C25C8